MVDVAWCTRGLSVRGVKWKVDESVESLLDNRHIRIEVTE